MAAKNSAGVAVFRFTFFVGDAELATGDALGDGGVAGLLAAGVVCEFMLLEVHAVTAKANATMNRRIVNRLSASRDIDALSCF